MQDFLSSIPFMGMVAILLLAIIGAIAACLFIVSGIHQQKVHQLRRVPHPKIVGGICLLVFAIAQAGNELVVVYAPRFGLSRYTVTLISLLANATYILLIVPFLYGAFFQIRNKL